MDLAPSPDQAALVDAALKWLSDNMGLADARKRSPALLQDMIEMSWIGMTSPDVGFDHATETLVFIEMGR